MAETPRKPVDTEADEELVAYLDGELDPREAATMATRIGLDPKLRAKADALQRAWDILDVLPKPQPSPTFVAHTVTQILPIRGPAAATMAALPAAAFGSRPWWRSPPPGPSGISPTARWHRLTATPTTKRSPATGIS